MHATAVRRQVVGGEAEAEAAQQDGVKNSHEHVQGRANYEVSCTGVPGSC